MGQYRGEGITPPQTVIENGLRYMQHHINGRTMLVRRLSYASTDAAQKNIDAATMQKLGSEALGHGPIARRIDKKLNPAIMEFKSPETDASPSVIVYERKMVDGSSQIVPVGFILAIERSRDIIARYMGSTEEDPTKRATVVKLLQNQLLEYASDRPYPKTVVLSNIVNIGLQNTLMSDAARRVLGQRGFDVAITRSIPGIDVHLTPRRGTAAFAQR